MSPKVLVSRCLLGHRVRYDGGASGPYALLAQWQAEGRVIAERRATFSCDAGMQRIHPRSPWPRLVLAGDFNDTPSSYTYREMKGALTDGFRRCGNGYGGTFRYLGGLLRIDYVFYDDTFECVRYYMPSEVVSDHKVVIAELRFK